MLTKRIHSKSRLGCVQCKRRRIKCDEVSPRCGSCSKKGIGCEYADQSTGQTVNNILTPATFADAVKPQARSTTSAGSSSSRPSRRDDPEPEFSSAEMLLMHHFTLHTSRTVGVLDEEYYHDIWQNRVPPMACQYRYLMHAVLGITAAHTSDLKTASHHYGQAISLFPAAQQATLSLDHADPVFCYCILIMLLTVVLECKDWQGHGDPVTGVVNFFNAARTAMPMLKTFEARLVEGQVMGLLQHMSIEAEPHEIPDDVRVSLDCLEQLITADKARQITPKEDTALKAAMVDLRQFFRVVEVRPSSWAYIMQWPLTLKAEYMALLQQGDLAALALLSHWCVPLHHAPQRWFCEGWPKDLILAVAEKLDQSVYQDVAAWPKSQVG